ncbi:MAG: nucleotide pyrophosphohydrolase [Spirosomataceae bacterium]
MTTIQELTELVKHFRDERDWAQFHTGKNLAISLNVESAELLELFLWKNSDEVNIESLNAEIADVFYNLLLIADKFKVDLNVALLKKLEENAHKYPIEKARGKNLKYDAL